MMNDIRYTRGASSPSYIRMAGARPFYSPAIPKRPIGGFEEFTSLEGRRSSLGAGSINIDGITMFAAIGGGIAVLSAKSLPDPWPILAKVLGFGAMGFAVYRGFLEGGSAEAASDKNAPGSPVPGAAISIPESSAFAQVSGTFLSPTPGQKIGPGFLRTAYPARIILSNKSSSQVSFYYQILATEDPSYMWPIDKSNNAQVQGQVAQSYITLKPNEQRMIDLSLDPVTSYTVTTDKIGIMLTLQKRQSADAPWQNMGESVSFEYARSN